MEAVEALVVCFALIRTDGCRQAPDGRIAQNKLNMAKSLQEEIYQ